MKDKYKDLFAQTIKKILAALPKNAPSDMEPLIRQYYSRAPSHDLEEIAPETACTIAAALLKFVQARMPGAPKIRIYTPTQQEHGWSSHRPVLEILNDDMPFLVDSISDELIRQGLTVHVMHHPVLKLRRDKNGALIAFDADAAPGVEGKDAITESLIRAELSPLPESITAERLVEDLHNVLKAVRYAIEDWKPILSRLDEAAQEISENSLSFRREEIAEVQDFLSWLRDRNFIFLGYIEYDFAESKGKKSLSVVPDSELGIFRADDFDLVPRGLNAVPPELLHFAFAPQLVEITKSIRKSVVHRPVQMDYIGLKRFDATGKVIGERRFLGLYTSIVYYQSADHIPIIRRKIARTLQRSGFEPLSHDGKALKAILEFFPRDELFQISEDDLLEFSMGILALEARPKVGLFVRRDLFERFLSCMIFIPRERFSTLLREQIQNIVEAAYAGQVTAFYTQVSDSPLARLQLIVKVTPGQIPQVDTAALEAKIAEITHLWSDKLREHLLARFDEARAEALYHMYVEAFPKSYIGDYDTGSAIYDIEKINEALHSGKLSLELFTRRQQQQGGMECHLKIYSPGAAVALSDILPMLEHCGFRVIDETPFQVLPRGAAAAEVWIRDFRLMPAHGQAIDIPAVKARFEDALSQVWCGTMENDRFNALVIRSSLPARSVTLLRAYAKYLKQTAFPFSQFLIEQALGNHSTLAALLVALFEARFDPQQADASREEALAAQLEEALLNVTNLTEDRIIRRYMELIRATLRTNFYQKLETGAEKPVISFKFDSKSVPDLPLPRPFAEIFVYSPRVEGIHLRGGKVARGGLRWSDRHEDFRTEVLGLMKAQMVKNSVIVPVGSKGGFVVKQGPAPSQRDAYLQEGVECYRMYLRGLLDVTDNIVAGVVVPPAQLVRHDADDPYLVVAADKGTASFSDYANAVSLEYGFWLGDAFASGGSAGYDHKKMAITARGAWISVVRHFLEMGVDIASQGFTCTGIGDMSGDVFGNGMLLSRTMKLLAAFNHQHIFLDPNPDPQASFAERQRLFALPRSSWKDYDAAIISTGGGVFERSAKSISLSVEIRQALGIEAAALSPDELIKAILCAPVDLLWNGGIGTYVKAAEETHDQVGDRTNNGVRVNGRDLRCKIAGEGGNLGFTQRGRIEYARAGGRINTDAIDNSAGVDCSDHEVNIKIAFGNATSRGALTIEARNALLVEMTEDVGELVLKDNRLQTQAITVAQLQGYGLLEAQVRLMQSLERRGLLNRAVEFLPSDEELAKLRMDKRGLTRPEIAVLLAYSKLALYDELLASSLPDHPYFSADLKRYFPNLMRERFTQDIETHPLRREIIATFVTNSIVNRAGMTFFQSLSEDTGMGAADIACAYSAARDAFSLRPLWAEIENDNPAMSTQTRALLFAEANQFVERVTRWFLQNCPLPLDLNAIIPQYQEGVEAFVTHFDTIISDPIRKAFGKKHDALTQHGVSQGLAKTVASLEALSSACDVIKVAGAASLPVEVVGGVYFQLGARLQLGWLRRCANMLHYNSHWERLAILSIVDDLYDQQRRLTAGAIERLCRDGRCSMTAEEWLASHHSDMERYDRFIADLKAAGTDPDLATLVVAARNVKGLCSN